MATNRCSAGLALRLRRRIHLPPASPPPRKRLRRSPLPPLLRKCPVIAGYRHRTVTRLYLGLAAAGVLLAALWRVGGLVSDGAVIAVLPLLCLGLWRGVAGRARAAQKRSVPR